jgi:hypothetical protein
MNVSSFVIQTFMWTSDMQRQGSRLKVLNVTGYNYLIWMYIHKITLLYLIILTLVHENKMKIPMSSLQTITLLCVCWKKLIYKKLKYGITIFMDFIFTEIDTNFRFLVQKSVKDKSYQKRSSRTKFVGMRSLVPW